MNTFFREKGLYRSMLFGSSGIRQEFGADLVDVALRVGSAVADAAPRIVVGRDTRTTSELLEHSVIAGMLSAGATVQTCGIAPTPTVAYAARDVNAGCMITASHNPESYNGVKLLNPDGSAFTRRQQVAIEDALTKSHWVGWNEQGCVTSVDAIAAHQEAILDAVSLSRPVTVVLDCGNGAGSVTTPELLARMGATVIELNCNISGRFARPSEPLEANLPYIGEIVRKRGAACAVIHDGDADRMMAFDDRGRYIDGDHLLILFAKYLDRKRVVTTVDASMAIEEVAEVRRTPVGDSFVSEELLSWGISAARHREAGSSPGTPTARMGSMPQPCSARSPRSGRSPTNWMGCPGTPFSANRTAPRHPGISWQRWERMSRHTASASATMTAGT